jgi:hypothetical protein
MMMRWFSTLAAFALMACAAAVMVSRSHPAPARPPNAAVSTTPDDGLSDTELVGRGGVELRLRTHERLLMEAFDRIEALEAARRNEDR